MRADAYAVSLYDDRRTVEGILFGLCHGVHGVEDVFAVAMDNLQVLEPREVVGNLAVGGLVFFRDGNAISVILDDEDDRQAFSAGTVDCFVDEAFGSGRFTVGSDGNSLVPVVNHGTPDAGSMQIMCAGCGGYIFDVPFCFCKMVGHMAASASQVGRLGDAVEYNFFGSHSCR